MVLGGGPGAPGGAQQAVNEHFPVFFARVWNYIRSETCVGADGRSPAEQERRVPPRRGLTFLGVPRLGALWTLMGSRWRQIIAQGDTSLKALKCNLLWVAAGKGVAGGNSDADCDVVMLSDMTLNAVRSGCSLGARQVLGESILEALFWWVSFCFVVASSRWLKTAAGSEKKIAFATSRALARGPPSSLNFGNAEAFKLPNLKKK